MSAKVLVVDDERNLRLMLEQMLELAGHAVECVDSAEAGLERIGRGGIDAVLLDVRLSGMDGMQALRAIRRDQPDVAIVMMSGHGTIETAVQAVRLGAFDFLEKPLGRDKTLLTLQNALRMRDLARENRELRALSTPTRLLGQSLVMQELRQRIAQVAPTQARVLIEGESGTGKELVARAIHDASPRASKPFLAVNCAAIPGELIESELFGHVRGAFTGATAARSGVFEAAHGGTLFLDEIGDMPLPLQAKLLRVLETGEVTRVGTTATVKVDVRVVAATHQNLAEAVEDGRFRRDLYHRLNVVPLVAPALRERLEDIPELAQAFLEREIAAQKLPRRRFSSEGLQALGRYHWPGNVRELRNLVERLAILTSTESIDAATVEAELGREAPQSPTLLRLAVEDAERRAIQTALRGAGGNVSEAARRLGLERSHLYKKAKSLGISLTDQ